MTDLDTLLALAEAKGTDREYHEFIKRQPSCISGEYSEYHDTGEAFCIPAHVRRSRDAGTAFKPRYAQVPLTDAEHKTQSQLGEAACLERYLGGTWTPEAAKVKFDELRVENLRRWVES